MIVSNYEYKYILETPNILRDWIRTVILENIFRISNMFLKITPQNKINRLKKVLHDFLRKSNIVILKLIIYQQLTFDLMIEIVLKNKYISLKFMESFALILKL